MKVSRKKRLFLFGALMAFVIAIPATIFILQQQQETRSKAQASTTLSFSPSGSSASPLQHQANDIIPLNIVLNPGSNFVSVVTLEINYDASKFEPSGTNAFVSNSSVFPRVLEGPVYSPGKVQVSLSIGADPTQAVQTTATIGTLTLKALSNTSGPMSITFGPNTKVFSVAAADQSTENVLASTTPTYIQVGTTVSPTTTGYSVSGTVYLDTNRNGVRDSGENGVPDMPMRLTTAPSIFNTTTDANGFYIFQNVTSVSDPIVSALILPDWRMSTVTNSSVIVNAGENSVVNFGVVPAVSPTVLPTSTPAPTSTPIPTNTPIPTATLAPQATNISLTLFLHGIGQSGDNTNPTNFTSSNKAPFHPSRPVDIEILDTNNVQVFSDSATLTYQTSSGNFTGNFALPSSFASGSYLVRVKTDGYLRKFLFGNQSITKGATNSLSTTTLVAGDIDNDNSLSALDYGILLDCGYGDLDPLPMDDPSSTYNSEACEAHTGRAGADVNDDGVIDRKDFNLYLREVNVQNGD